MIWERLNGRGAWPRYEARADGLVYTIARPDQLGWCAHWHHGGKTRALYPRRDAKRWGRFQCLRDGKLRCEAHWQWQVADEQAVAAIARALGVPE